jgi:hypothetical protein
MLRLTIISEQWDDVFVRGANPANRDVGAAPWPLTMMHFRGATC